MKILGYILQEEEVNDAVILCYIHNKMAKDMYSKLKQEKYRQNMHHRIKIRLIWSPDEEYQYKIVIEFINRNKNIYVNPPKFLFEGSDLDEFQERMFLSIVNIEDCKILYSGDVPNIGNLDGNYRKIDTTTQ